MLLAIQNWCHDIGNVVVIRIEANDARDVVTNEFDFDIAVVTVADLALHEEAAQSTDMNVVASVLKFAELDGRNNQNATIRYTRM